MKKTLIATGMLIALASGVTGQALSVAVAPDRVVASTPDLKSPRAPARGNDVSSPVGAPTLAFVFDEGAGAIRRVPGVDGSAYVGELIPVGQPLSAGFTSPQQDYAAGLTATGQILLITFSHGSAISVSPLEEVPVSPDRLVFSPTGNTLAVLYSSTSKVMVVTGVPRNPAAGPVWDLTQYGGTISALAIQDGGIGLAGITQSDGAGSLILLSPNGSTSVITAMGGPSAIQFVWGKNDAVVADSVRGTVSLLQNVSGALETLALVTQSPALAHPDLVAIDRFSQLVVTAQSGGNSGLAVNLVSGAVQPFVCSCAINTFEPLNGTSVYRISDFTGGGFLTLSADYPNLLFQAITIQARERAKSEAGRVR
jgi:hypothetical protein